MLELNKEYEICIVLLLKKSRENEFVSFIIEIRLLNIDVEVVFHKSFLIYVILYVIAEMC